MRELFKKIDRAVFHAERVFVVAALAVMSTVVFLDVLHRTFASEDNKGVAAFVKLLSYFGIMIERTDPSYSIMESWFPPVLFVAATALGAFGIRSAKLRTQLSVPLSWALSAAAVAGMYGGVLVFVHVVPNGLIWSSRLALVLTLWVGFVAASMCAYENKHLKVEAAQRAIPEAWRPWVVFLSSAFTAAVCLALMWLAARYVGAQHESYAQTQGRGALVEGLDLPLYQAFAVLPIAFAMMAVRFAARGVLALGGELPVDPRIEGIDETTLGHAAVENGRTNDEA